MSVVTFELVMPVDVPRDALWAGLVDWESHGDWIPTGSPPRGRSSLRAMAVRDSR